MATEVWDERERPLTRMIYIFWQFKVPPEHRVEFEKAYKGDGVWAQLFQRDPAYVRTILVADEEQQGSYLTIDVWKDRHSYTRFKERFASEYSVIDKRCEFLTESERMIGLYAEVVLT